MPGPAQPARAVEPRRTGHRAGQITPVGLSREKESHRVRGQPAEQEKRGFLSRRVHIRTDEPHESKTQASLVRQGIVCIGVRRLRRLSLFRHPAVPSFFFLIVACLPCLRCAESHRESGARICERASLINKPSVYPPSFPTYSCAERCHAPSLPLLDHSQRASFHYKSCSVCPSRLLLLLRSPPDILPSPPHCGNRLPLIACSTASCSALDRRSLQFTSRSGVCNSVPNQRSGTILAPDLHPTA